MRASYEDQASGATRSKRGTGSLRERSPGVWEVRVVVGFDPGRSRSIQRSFTVHGDAALAARARRDLVAEYGSARSDVRHTASAVTVGELLHGYLNSAQLWKPATTASHRHVVSTLAGDPLSSAVPDARGGARRDRPLARRRRVGTEGVSALAPDT